jgi:predicted dehydrogenase
MQTTAFLGVAHIHTPGFIKTINNRDDVRCKHVYDRDHERAQKRAGELDAQVAPDLDTVLNDAEITSVVICSETAFHADLVPRAVAAGKHLFVEKPLSNSVEEADAMQAAIEKAGLVFQTGFFMRSDPKVRFLKQEVEAGNLGTITRARYTNCHSGALGGWFDTQWRWIADADLAGGGGFADLGAHALDILLWTLRPTCGAVKNVAGMVGTATKRYGDIDEYGAGLLQFENGAIAEVEASWVDPKLSAPVEINGTRGQIQIKDGKVFYYSELVEGADGGEWTELPNGGPHAFELFWDKLEEKELAVPLITIDEAAEEARVMARLYQSLR